MSAALVFDLEHQTIRIHGDLNFTTVPLLRTEMLKLFQNQAISKQLSCDCSEVTHSNSAALALLTAIARHAKQQNIQIQFLNLPMQLLEVARMSNVDKVLSLSGRL